MPGWSNGGVACLAIGELRAFMIYAHRLPGGNPLPGFLRRLVADGAGEQVWMFSAGKVFSVAQGAVAHGCVALKATVWEVGRGLIKLGSRFKGAVLYQEVCCRIPGILLSWFRV